MKLKILALLFYITILIDFVTTKIGLNMGYSEQNPIMASAFDLFGMTLILQIGAVVFAIMTLLIFYRIKKANKLELKVMAYTLSILVLLRIYVIIGNLTLIL